MKIPPVEFLEECFDYCPDTGSLTWRERPAHHFKREWVSRAFNKRWAGKPAGSIVVFRGPDGYKTRVVNVSGFSMGAHRIALAMSGVSVPDGMVVDHINRDPLDNRLCNLRVVSNLDNLKNATRSRNNTSGHTGVYRHRKKWTAMIGYQGKVLHLGVFDNVEDAIECRIKAEKLYGYSDVHGK